MIDTAAEPQEDPSSHTPPHDRWRRARDGARRHRFFLVVLVLGTAFRVVTQAAYRPALLYTDSFRYLSYDNLHRLYPTGLDPIGYDAMVLRPLLWSGNLAAVTIAQHVLGFAMGVGIYALLLHKGVRPWLAALAAVPVLLDAYQVQIEQNIMSDTLFQCLVLAAVGVLIWRARPGFVACMVAGFVLGVSVSVRLVGVPFVVPAVVFVLLASAGPWWTRLAKGVVLAVAFALPLLAYMGWYHHVAGEYRLTPSDAGALYGRAVVIVDCKETSLPAYERPLCPSEPFGHRDADFYAHSTEVLARVHPPKGMTPDDVQRDFALRVFAQEPIRLIESILHDFGRGFTWPRTSGANEVALSRWQFQDTYPVFARHDPLPVLHQWGSGGPTVSEGLASFLRGYQLSVGYLPGPIIAAMLLVGLLGAVGVGRARRSDLRAACFLTTFFTLTLLLAAAAFEFSWRYQLPALVLAPLAGALGLTALMSAPRPLLATWPDVLDDAAVAAFGATYGEVRLAPVIVVIAAYQEEETLGAVLDELPRTVCGLGVDSIVVVDGATDATAETAMAHDAHVCAVPTNRGQGAALRLGYHLASAAGARYIVTTDADGQYDGAEMATLVDPLVSDEADFVSGSRWLGRQETKDPIRRIGSRLFAKLATLLTGHHITDTSFGFRALRAEITDTVELRQPQYQASELLIEVLCRGYRVVERPMTLRVRTHGTTKKGNPLVYGTRYARAMIGTWFRARRYRRTPRRTSASATVE